MLKYRPIEEADNEMIAKIIRANLEKMKLRPKYTEFNIQTALIHFSIRFSETPKRNFTRGKKKKKKKKKKKGKKERRNNNNLFVERAARLYVRLGIKLIGLEEIEAFLKLRAVLFDWSAS